MKQVKVQIRRLDHFPDDWSLPSYATPGAAGVDLRNAGPSLTLDPLERRAVPTGLALALPPGIEGQVRPRSGLALRDGVGMVNAPGTIDSDYRGEILIPLINYGREPVEISHGERIAQLLLGLVPRISWEPTDRLPPSTRGHGGFGSTGR